MTSAHPFVVDPGQDYLSDTGIETDLIFNRGVDLPYFASFVLLDSEQGLDTLRSWYRSHAEVARQAGTGFVLESPTWRSSADWGDRLGLSAADLDAINRAAVELVAQMRAEWAGGAPAVVSGCLGPRGDGYQPAERMSAEQARVYHAPQLESFAAAGVDHATAMTIGYPEEAIGIARAAIDLGLPSVISFTVETDGTLPDGTALGDAVGAVDEATDAASLFFMVNCAHPDHIAQALAVDGAWQQRIRGIRANASRMSHAELDASETLDAGDPQELGRLYSGLREQLPQLRLLGGCCGTDLRHAQAIAAECFPSG
jgi:homocysteine S-methyltransferase